MKRENFVSRSVSSDIDIRLNFFSWIYLHASMLITFLFIANEISLAHTVEKLKLSGSTLIICIVCQLINQYLKVNGIPVFSGYKSPKGFTKHHQILKVKRAQNLYVTNTK